VTELIDHDVGVDPTPDEVGPAWPGRSNDRRLKVGSALAGTAAGAVPFLLVLWNFGARPLRSALPNRLFSDFFDIQARALLDGRLAVPNGALGFEAFRHDGHEYMYFGAWPALLRMPVVALTDRLDGRLSAPSMLLAWLVAAAGSSMLVWRVRALVAPDRPVTRTEAVVVAVLLAIVLGGSPVLYLAALPWVYSEALLWSAAASVMALFGVIGILERPSARRIVFAGLLTVVAVLSRVTAGWGCGLAVLGVAVLFLFAPRFAPYRRWWPWVTLAGAVPLGIGIAINYAKFGHPILLPFESQIWTEMSERRRLVLDQGGVTGVRFLPATLVNYLRPDGIRVSPIFPFITPPASPASEVGGVMLEMPYRTPSVTSVMPLLVGLGIAGVWRIFRPGAETGPATLRVPLLGALSILGGVLFVGYIAPRYTAEFIPSLLIAAAAAVLPVLDRIAAFTTRTGRRAVWTLLTACALYGVVANVSIAAVAARVGEGGSSMRALVEMQHRVSNATGHPLDRRVDLADRVPLSSRPERILIVGRCDTMLVGTGDLFEPWVPVEMRPLHIEIEMGDHQTNGSAVIVNFAGGDGAVIVEVLDFEYRLVVTGDAYGYTSSEWRPSAPGTRLSIDIAADFLDRVYSIVSPEHLYASRDVAEFGQDAIARFVDVEPVVGSPDQAAIDVRVQVSREDPSTLCRELLDAAT
jgi:hypothetical protein